MSDTPYNDLDPWHSWANLVFGFTCKQCGVEVEMEWGPETDKDDGFMRSCVEVSERAQRAGWVRTGATDFLCPICGASRMAG
jgi:hypothetical protein